MTDTRNSYPNESIAPGPDRLTASPAPVEAPPVAKTSEYAHHDKLPSHAEPGVIRRASNPIHHSIAPALATPFMQAQGLIHRGHLIHRYEDGSESPVPVQLKSLGNGTVITQPTWDSSSSSSSPEPEKELSTPTDGEMPESNLKLVDGGKTYVLASNEPAVTREPRKSLTKRRQSGHRREFHNLIFKPQYSTLDRSNPISAASPFIGFYTLFWLGLVMFSLRTFLVSYRTTGQLFGHRMLTTLRKDLVVLAAFDATMFASTFVCVLLQKAVNRGWLSWTRSGWILQHIWQMTFLGGTIAFTFFREWDWPQTVFILLHSLVLLMKQHSYAFYTGWLSAEALRLQRLQAELRFFDKNITPEIGRRGSIIEDRERLVTEIENTKQDLTGAVLHEVTYPNNLTMVNFLDFMFCPTLIYELEYPRMDTVRWGYVFEKAAATFGSIALMIVITEQYVLPAIQPILPSAIVGMTITEKFIELGWVLLDMVFPYHPVFPLFSNGRFITLYLLSFYIIFECVLNAFAEITRFADRGFYDAWWNSTTWDQFAREWNKPVHLFLLRHVYHSSISAFSISKTNATFITFFLSACVHELVMACMFHRLRGYLLGLQMSQLPLIFLARTTFFRKRQLLGHVMFWVGIFTGPSLLSLLYLMF